MSESTQDPRKIRTRLRSYERKLKKEKEKYGFYRDGAGKPKSAARAGRQIHAGRLPHGEGTRDHADRYLLRFAAVLIN